MLIRRTEQLIADAVITIQKQDKTGADVSLRGAFSVEDCVSWKILPPRVYGVQGIVMHIAKDGEMSRDIPFVWQGDGSFVLTLSMEELCGDVDNGLF